MRIGIDAHFASYELRGMGKYILRLVSGLPEAGEENEYIVYGDSQMFPHLKGRGNVKFRNPGGLPYPLWEQFVLPLWARRDRLDLLHCPANTAPIALSKSVKLVITIHDVMYLLPPSVLSASNVLRQKLGGLYRSIVVPLVARRAERVITVSEFSKSKITEYLKISSDIIRPIYVGIDPDFASLANEIESPPEMIGDGSLDSPFILALGAGDPRKNTLGAIRAYASRLRELVSQEQLVIVGLRDWRSSAAYRLVCQLGLTQKVLFAGYVSEAMLVWFYRSARCFLYPSLYEGFGLPPLEAMACGTPVITSDCTSMPEIAGDAALLVQPSSEQSIGDALVGLLGDEPLRRELIERGRARVQKFRWGDTVRKTLEVYKELG